MTKTIEENLGRTDNLRPARPLPSTPAQIRLHRQNILLNNINHPRFAEIFLTYYEDTITRARSNASIGARRLSVDMLHDAYSDYVYLAQNAPAFSAETKDVLRQGIVKIHADFSEGEVSASSIVSKLAKLREGALEERERWINHFRQHPALSEVVAEFDTPRAASIQLPKDTAPKDRDLSLLKTDSVHPFGQIQNRIVDWMLRFDNEQAPDTVLALYLQNPAHKLKLVERINGLLEDDTRVNPARVAVIARMLRIESPSDAETKLTNLFAQLLTISYAQTASSREAAQQALARDVTILKEDSEFASGIVPLDLSKAVFRLYLDIICKSCIADAPTEAIRAKRLDELKVFSKFCIYGEDIFWTEFFGDNISHAERGARLKAYRLACCEEFDRVSDVAPPHVALNMLHQLAFSKGGTSISRGPILSFAKKLLLETRGGVGKWKSEVAKLLRTYRFIDEEIETILERTAITVEGGALCVDGSVALYFSQIGSGSKEFWQVVESVIDDEQKQLKLVVQYSARFKNFSELSLAALERDYHATKDRYLACTKMVVSALGSQNMGPEHRRFVSYGRLLERSDQRLFVTPTFANTVSTREVQLSQRLREALPDVPFRTGLSFERAISIDLSLIDSGLTSERRPIAIQVDGDQYHFIDGNRERGFDGNTTLKTALLVENGIDVIRIPVSYMERFYGGGSSVPHEDMITPIKSYILHGQTRGMLVVNPRQSPPKNLDRPVLFRARSQDTRYSTC